MRLDSRLQLSRHGVYYLRMQTGGIDRKWSLRTRDPVVAAIAAHEFSAKLLQMKNTPHLSSWSMKVDGNKIEISTEDNDQDRASARAAALEIIQAQAAARAATASVMQSAAPLSATQAPTVKTVSLGASIDEYLPTLADSELAVKSQAMASSVLVKLKALLGAEFNMADLTDAVIKERWYKDRTATVSKTTAKRDLSFVRGFVSWAVDKKYTESKLTFAVAAKGKNYEYFTSSDLRSIFDNLPQRSDKSWEFWIPIIALWTGARIAEIANIRADHVYEKSGLNILRLAGTKTEASDREVPIPHDLVRIGFLEYVEYCRRLKKEMLFDLPRGSQNGAGAQASKFFTEFKREIGITHPLKVFHSFRATIVDHLKQADVGYEARCQYMGHDDGGGVHNEVYARKLLSLTALQNVLVDKIDWRQYCGWQPDFGVLKAKADTFIKR